MEDVIEEWALKFVVRVGALRGDVSRAAACKM
jgi:hypothetical protein